MSAASRYKATAPQRERRRVAREIAKLEHGSNIFCGMCSGIGDDIDDDSLPVYLQRDCGLCEGTGSGRRVFELSLLDGGAHFDVARANEHALSLIRKDAPNVHDQRRVDLGLAIQRALKGQPSECQACEGKGGGMSCETFGGVVGDVWWDTCNSCHGSGHNLRGVLPHVEWSAQVRRKVADSCAAMGDRIDGWTARYPAGNADRVPTVTRVGARGTHRDDIDRWGLLAWAPGSVILGGASGGYSWNCAPKWKRGELIVANRQAQKRGQS